MLLLRARLRPVAAPPGERVAALMAKLDAPGFAAREAAEKELRDLGDTVLGALQTALRNQPTAEQKVRLERLATAAITPAVPAGGTGCVTSARSRSWNWSGTRTPEYS